MGQLFANNARAALLTGISAIETTLLITSALADLFPTANTGTAAVGSSTNWFKATLEDSAGNTEIVYVRSRTSGSNVLSNVQRGREGTTARAFTSGSVIGLRVTATDIAEIKDAAETAGSAPAVAISASEVDALQNRLAGEVWDTDYATPQLGLTAAAGKVFRITTVAAAALLTGLVPADDTTIIINAAAALEAGASNIDIIDASGKTNVHVINFGRLQQTAAAGAGAYVAAVNFDGSTDCTYSGPGEIVGMQWAGDYMANAVRCKSTGGRFLNWQGSVDNSAAIVIYQDCEDCIAEDFYADGTGWLGAYIQDPGGAGIYNPVRNKLRNFIVKNVAAYAAMLYIGATGNSYNEITGGTIDTVTGTAGAGQYGMPIYCVGYALGGCVIKDNKLTNGCINQTVFTNGCGGIVVTGSAAGTSPVQVSGNGIAGMTQGNGIELVTLLSGAVVGPNDVVMPVANDGTGPGGAGALGSALKIWNCLEVSVSPGNYKNHGAGAAITVLATDRNMTGINVAIGNATATESPALNVAQVGGYTITGSITGGTLKGVSDTSAAAVISYFNGPLDGVTMSNGATGAATPALQMSNSTVHATDNKISSTGTYSVSLGAGCTGKWDKSNSHTGRFENSAPGMVDLEVSGAGRPTVGIFQIGNRWFNTAPVAGEAESYRCLTAGSATHVIGTDWFPVGICLPCVTGDLTTPAAGLKGARGLATDANATTFASVVAGGGANNVPVYCDGTNWRIG